MSLSHVPPEQIGNGSLFVGDNLGLLRCLASESVDLVYLDPPFNSNRRYAAPATSEAAGASFEDRWTAQHASAADWETLARQHPSLHALIEAAARVGSGGDGAYLVQLALRLVELQRLLRSSGSLYLHCDPTMSHSVKLCLDALFGWQNFRNEIIWCYKKWTNTLRGFQKNHDVILFYTKSDVFTFHKPFGELTEPMRRIRARGYNAGSSAGKRILRVYDANNPKAAAKIEDGDYDALYYVREPARGVPLPDYWDLPFLGGRSAERTGYPTQKPLALLERIIRTSSNLGEVVLDPFCGSGTTCLAAERLQRAWIGIDSSPRAIDVVRKRFAALADAPQRR